MNQQLTKNKSSKQSIKQIIKSPHHTISQHASVLNALQKIQILTKNNIEITKFWVINETNKLLGYINITDLLFNKSHYPIKNIMHTKFITITTLTLKEEAIKICKKHNLYTLPVVNNKYNFIGYITLNNIISTLSKNNNIILKNNNHKQKINFLQNIKIRLPWLSVSFISSLLSAFLIYNFETLFIEIPFLFAFVPVISAMGGSIGLQSATIIIEDISLHKLEYKNLLSIILYEAKIGLFFGIITGIIGSIIPILGLKTKVLIVSLTIFIALILSMLISTIIGTLAPSILHKFKINPTVASGPILQTSLDLVTVFIFVSIALTTIKTLGNDK